jgi:hypothetical protein
MTGSGQRGCGETITPAQLREFQRRQRELVVRDLTERQRERARQWVLHIRHQLTGEGS